VCDTNRKRIQKFTNAGAFVGKWGSSGSLQGLFNFPDGAAVDFLGNVYVTDTGNNRLQKFTSSGVFLSQWGSYGTGQGQFSTPFHSCVAPNGDVFVSDSDNQRIQRFSPQTPIQSVSWGKLRSMYTPR